MADYALVKVLRGKCNNMGMREIVFKYPLQTDHEKDLHKQAMEMITQRAFQLSYFWSLVEPADHERFLQACASLPGAQSELVIQPVDSMHGELYFDKYMRFDGYTMTDKERLVQTIMETGIAPAVANLEFSYQHFTREMEQFTGNVDTVRLEKEQQAAFAKYVSFYTEQTRA